MTQLSKLILRKGCFLTIRKGIPAVALFLFLTFSDVKLPCQEPPSSEFTAYKTKQKNKTGKVLPILLSCLEHVKLLNSMEYTRTFLFLGTCVPVLLSAMRAKQLRARVPIAKKVKDTIYFGVNPKDPTEDRGPNSMNPPKERTDWYNWLRDETRKDPEVLSHILKENAYCDEMTSDLKPLQEELYQDMLGRLKETDDEVPYQHGPYLYYTRTVKGKRLTHSLTHIFPHTHSHHLLLCVVLQANPTRSTVASPRLPPARRRGPNRSFSTRICSP